MFRRPLAVGAALVLGVLTACSANTAGSDGSPGKAASKTVPTTGAGATTSTTLDYPVFTVATAEVSTVQVYDAPDQPQPSHSIDNPNPTYGTPRVFLVQDEKADWLNVLLPMRPNGSTGWIRKSDVSLTHHDYRIVIELGAHRITVYNKKEIFLQEPVGVGRGTTPTPGGLFYTTELLIPVGQPAYGPYAYGLSGYSDVLYDFAGGDGQFGIHGTNDPSGIGRDVSNGCIRMGNEAITKLAETLPIGVPVEIKA